MPSDEVDIQTDNGSEYTRNSKQLSVKSAFEQEIERRIGKHIRIPLGAKNYQSDVERSNGLIEYELLEIEKWKTRAELIVKTTAWEYYFNRLRPNSYQQNMSPYQRMLEAGVDSKTAEQACLWTVTILDDTNYQNFDFNFCDHGYDVCSFDEIFKSILIFFTSVF